MKKLSMQWHLTLLITALVTIACLFLNLLLSQSAITGIEQMENYMVQVQPDEADDESILLNIDPNSIFPDLSQQVETTKQTFHLQSILITAVIILLSSVSTYFLAGRALKPLQQLSSRIQKIQAQNLATPLDVPNTDDEIAHLTRSFNEMLTRLDESFQIQKRFSANAAHELRTPLAVIQTNLDIFQKRGNFTADAYSELLSMIQEQIVRLSKLVGVLLEMTELQTIQRTDSFSLAELTEEVLCDLAQIAEDKQITLVQEEGDCMFTGSYTLLYRAVFNLVENAIKYNLPHGTVTVGIQPDSDTVILTVSDTGIGISPENQEKIFEPFFRVDKSRSRAMGGVGLGLTMVKNIIKEHLGEVHIRKSNGGGTEIAVSLPRRFPHNQKNKNPY